MLLCVCLLLTTCSPAPLNSNASLKILLWDHPTTMNPNQDFDSITDSVLFNVFESLVALDEQLHLRPALAVGWENPNPEIWRFHLRPNVKFHDGTPLTASLVRNALLHVKGAGYETSNILSPVQEIRVINDATVDLITSTPSALLSKLPFVYIFQQKATSFFGTGPYQISEWNNDGEISLKRFEQYWGTPPEFAEARFESVRDSAKRLQMLTSGNADMIYYLAMNTPAAPPGIAFVRHTGLSVYYLGFDLSDPKHPFSDLRVRQAINLAINRTQIIAQALHGNGSLPTQPVAPFVFGFDPAIATTTVDVERARKLMNDAGYSEGFQVTLDINASRKAVADRIRDDLAKIRIDVKVNGQGRNEVYSLLEAGKSRFFLAGWDCSSGDASEFYEFNLHTPDEVFGQGNYGKYSNKEMDEICEKHYYITDELERRLLLQKAGQLAMRDLPVLPVFIEDDLYAIKDTLHFNPRADGQIRVADVTLKKK